MKTILYNKFRMNMGSGDIKPGEVCKISVPIADEMTIRPNLLESYIQHVFGDIRMKNFFIESIEYGNIDLGFDLQNTIDCVCIKMAEPRHNEKDFEKLKQHLQRLKK